MSKLATRISEMQESATIAMSRKSREMKEQGVDVISLSLGEPDFNTPEFIKDAANQAMVDNFTKYPPVNGYLDVREAICEKFKRDNNLTFAPDQIVVSTGAKQSITNAIMATVNPGDEVIIPAPYWVSYIEMVRLAGGIPVIIETEIENDFKVTEEQLANAVNEKTALMIFSTPCNPTGSFYSRAELQGVANVLKNNDFLVICDEIYEHINFAGKHESLASFDEVKDKVITVNGVSKAFAMTGWRIGFIGASKEIAAACTKYQGQITSGACSISQKAAKAAVLADKSQIQYMIDAFDGRRKIVYDLLKDMPGFEVNMPEGAFYFFPRVKQLFGKSYNGNIIKNADDLAMYLLEEGEVACVTGAAFGSPDYLRISYASSEEVLREALRRIREALEKLS